MNRNKIMEQVKDNDYLQNKLFCKGFIITDDLDVDGSAYPFYGKWTVTPLGTRYVLAVHPDQTFYVKTFGNGLTIGLVGHAYRPADGVTDETCILDELSRKYFDREQFFDVVNQLTGCFCLFVAGQDKIEFLSDALGLYSVFYASMRSHIYIAAHSNLLGDLLGLYETPFVTKLKSCKTFKYFGNQLPGNITRFAEVWRLNPNHYGATEGGEVRQTRFYWPHSLDMNNEEICNELIGLLQKTADAISQKWHRPALSLTGGCDSKTFLACVSHRYEDFTYFSYDSQPNELPDAQAAAAICQALGMPHTLYKIPYEDEAFEQIEEVRSVLLWNGGDVRYNNPNDVRKRIYLDQVHDFDVEIKSWASEVGRARYTKRYNGRRRFGKKPTPRKCTTFYKFLFFNRVLVNRCDRVFKEYLEKYFEQDKDRPIPWQDQFYWEWHWPSRDGVNLTCEQIYSNDITVPYNNRCVLELLLSACEEDRVNDVIYTEIRNRLDGRIDQATMAVVDVNHTSKRALLEDLYYIFNRLLPY